MKGYKTTWGADHKDQTLDEDAEIVRRLDAAGAVLVAKLTCGRWPWARVVRRENAQSLEPGGWLQRFIGEARRRPWPPGAWALRWGTETMGSIVSPCTRCGASGLRPTFGRVPRTGLWPWPGAWTRSVPSPARWEDCALIFSVLQGPDDRGLTVVEAPFAWDAGLDIRKLRVGYAARLFEKRAEVDPDADKKEEDTEWPAFDKEVIDVLLGLGLKLAPVELPDLPADSMALLPRAEAAAAWRHAHAKRQDALLTAQGDDDWPNLFRQAQLIPAVQYIQANRARTVPHGGHG